MELRRCIVLLLLGLLGVTYAQDFYVAAPSSLRLNSDETVAVAVDGRNADVNVTVQEHPGKKKTIFQTNVQVQADKPQTFKIRLDAAQFPADFLTAPVSPKLVSLNVRVQNTNKEILIPISSQSGYMFIQSDKPIYTPLERASFRIIPLTEEGLPSTERFKFQIKNPDDIIVDERMFNERNKKLPYNFATHIYQFPSFPVLGEWTAVVRYGNNLEQNSTVKFELQEYVLPTFTVKVKTPKVILPHHDTITIDVEAKYVYGKKVNGMVSYRIGVKKEHSPTATYFALINPKLLNNGADIIRISTNDLKVHKDIGWFPGLEGSVLVVEATVVDDATGNKIVETDSKSRFSKSPFLISFKRCLSDFRPGLTSIFEADITFVDGTPAEGILTRIRAVADNGRPLNIAQSASRSNANGVVTFEIHPENHHKTITFTLETDDPRYAGSQAKGTYQQKAYQSRNNAYIAISRSSPLRLQPGDVFARDVHFEPKGIQNIYYLVVAKGKIQMIDKLPQGAFKVQRFEFRITYDMIPSFRIAVFAHYGNDLVADSLKIDVAKICDPRAEVTLETAFNQAEPEPGSGGKIIMRGTKDTSVGLLGVDEAVYALSRKDLLSKEKMFDKLASHDLGCGPGGGVNINSVLGNAGITIGTNKFTPSHSHSCVEIKRKKRSLAVDLVTNYNGTNRMCCGLGLRQDIHYRDCLERYDAVRDTLESVHTNCSLVYLECCQYGEDQEVTGMPYFAGRLVGDNNEGLQILDPELEDEFERQTTVRKDFRETWINTNHIIGPDNKEEIEVSLPHSITTWVIQAVSVSPTHGICVAEPKKLVSFKKLFLHLNLPYSIKRYEQVEVQATLFNYHDRNITANVFMYGVEGLCSGTEPGLKSERKKLYIDKHSAETVTFSIIPLKVEDIPVKFVALTAHGQDVIEKKLHVVQGGVTEEKDATIRIDPSNRQRRQKRHIESEIYSDFIDPTQNLQVTAFKLNLPNDTVPGSARCAITATGDIVGPSVETSLKNPDGLIQKPHGCGEQNMIRLAPTIYTMKYLKITGRLTDTRERNGKEFIRHGYDNELKYKKTDGSYAIWANSPTSTWLTAFVMKVFCQATEFIPIDKNVISSGIAWLVRNQEADGSYIEKHKVYHWDMMGGVDGATSMTAYALIALEECKHHDEKGLSVIRDRAVAYLESRINTTQTPLPAAVLAYALALSNSKEKQAANDRLLSMARHDPNNNYMYWSTRNSAQDIETAGYGLLTQLLFNDMARSGSIVNWLNTKQLQSGEFKSTQDTVIALQSLSEYATKAPLSEVNLVSNITYNKDRNFHKVLAFTNANALEAQVVQIENPDGMVFVNTAGHGMGTLSMKLRYSVFKSTEEICKFEIKETVTEVKVYDHLLRGAKDVLDRDPYGRRKRSAEPDVYFEAMAKDIIRRTKRQNKDQNKDYALKINICVKYLGNQDAEMSIVDVGIFSGFVPVIKDLDELERNPRHLIQRYEKSSRGVVFYLEKVPIAQDYCFSFQVYREYIVGNTQSSVIKAYEYYNPDAACSKFYSPEKNSALIRKICDGGVCECAEGGCPTKNPFSGFLEEDRVERRDQMKAMFCDEYDYAWKGTLHGRLRKDGGFVNMTFMVQEVIKPGVEKKEDVENKTRILRAQDHCEVAKLFTGATYLILGKDPPARLDGGDVYYRYLFDKSSIIHHWTSVTKSPNKELQRDLDFVTKELKRNGCEL